LKVGGIEALVDHRPDLDAADADIVADIEAIDRAEAGDHLVAIGRRRVGTGISEGGEGDGDRQHRGAHQGFEDCSSHRL